MIRNRLKLKQTQLNIKQKGNTMNTKTESTKWEPLNLDKLSDKDLEIEFDVDDDEENNSKTKQSDDETKVAQVSEGEDEPDGENEDEGKTPVEQTKRRRRKSRTEQKISQLVEENKNLRTQLVDEFSKIRTEFQTTKTASEADDKLRNVNEKLSDIEAKLAKAYEDSNYAEIAKLNRNQSELLLDKRVLEAQKLQTTKSDTKQIQATTETQTTVETPEAYKDWVVDKEWLDDPQTRDERKLRRYVRKAAKQLEDDGFDYNEDDFYEELDSKIEKFVSANKLDVEGYEIKEPKKQVQTSPVNTQRRDSGITKRNGKVVVRLTPEEREMAKNLNLSESDYAKHKAKLNGSGYTSIF